MDSTRIKCVCLLIGAPGSGKTYISKHLDDLLQSKGYRVQRISFDDNVGDDFDENSFKLMRSCSKDRVRVALQRADVDILVVDDIMYLASMRRELYVIARNCDATLLCVHINASLATSQARNNRRSGRARLRDNVVEKLHLCFEPLSRCTAEKHSLVVLNEEDTDVSPQVQEIHAAIMLALEQCLQAELKEVPANDCIDGSETSAKESILQMFDLELRKKVGYACKQARMQVPQLKPIVSLKQLKSNALSDFRKKLSGLDHNLETLDVDARYAFLNQCLQQSLDCFDKSLINSSPSSFELEKLQIK